MSTHWIPCDSCGFDIGSAQEGYEEGCHPECRPFKHVKVLVTQAGPFDLDFGPVDNAAQLEEAVNEGLEVIVFDLTEPFQPFSEGSFPKGGMKR